MSRRIACLSVLFGLVWHTIVVLCLRGGFAEVASFHLVAGGAAGLAAGCLTIRSRQRRDGREHFLDLMVTYYSAVLIYALVRVVIDLVTGAGSHGHPVASGEAGFAAVWFMGVSLVFATQYLSDAPHLA